MVHTKNPSHIAVFLLLEAIPLALSHGDGHGDQMADSKLAQVMHTVSGANATKSAEQSYFAYPDCAGLMLGHIGLMIAAWFFVLPIGKHRSSKKLGFPAN